MCSVAPSVQNSRPAQRRFRPKQGGAVLRPKQSTVRPDIDVLYQGHHQGLAVVRPSIPVSMFDVVLLPWTLAPPPCA